MRSETVADKIGALVDAEKRERAKAAKAKADAVRDRLVMQAERHADEAWSLAENDPDAAHIPSPIWSTNDDCAVRAA